MVKEEKTIDGFPVRRLKDSALVARSKAKQGSNVGTGKKIKAITGNDPLVKKAMRNKTGEEEVSFVRRGTSMDMKRSKATSKQIRKISRVKTAALFAAEPEAFDYSPDADELERRSQNDVVDKRVVTESPDNVSMDMKASEDFLAPVESFDAKQNDSSTKDGIITDVDNEEEKDMRKLKRELKERKKKTLREQKKFEKRAKAEKKKKKSIIGRIIKWFLIILLLLAIGVGVYLYFWGDGILRKITGGKGNVWSAIGALTSETYEPLKTDENGRTNILVFGTSGFDMAGKGFDGYQHDGSQLTDSIMVVSLDQDNGDVAIVSLPRDLYAGYTCTATSKINEVYWCNNQYGEDEEAGAVALQGKIKEILGIDTQYWVHMNWGALVNIVDAVGGVEIVLDEDINDAWYTGAIYQAGVPYTLDGYAALALSRARHGTAYGDFSRAASQQKILIGIKNKVVERGLGLNEAMSIISAVGDNLRMDLDMKEIKTGMHLLETFDLDSVRQIPVLDDETRYMTYANRNNISYIIPSAGFGVYGPLQEYIAKQMKSSPAEREGAVIIVYNGSGEPGVAAQERELLEENGYGVREIANAPEGEYKYLEDIEIYDASEGLKPETKKALERFYGIEMKDMSLLPNGISPIGYDFIIIIGDPLQSNIEEE